ncbi:MAG: septum formation initiator family protein [Succinivibrionaceae bacterium]
MLHFINVVLLLILVFLVNSLVFGNNGYRKNIFIVNELNNAKKETKSLADRNRILKLNIEDLKNNKSYESIEDLARSNLEFIKPDETFYRVIIKND